MLLYNTLSSQVILMTNNYFNSNIISNHSHRIELMNNQAEFATFCLSLTTIFSDTDNAWWTEVKKSNICYDV